MTLNILLMILLLFKNTEICIGFKIMIDLNFKLNYRHKKKKLSIIY